MKDNFLLIWMHCWINRQKGYKSMHMRINILTNIRFVNKLKKSRPTKIYIIYIINRFWSCILGWSNCWSRKNRQTGRQTDRHGPYRRVIMISIIIIMLSTGCINSFSCPSTLCPKTGSSTSSSSSSSNNCRGRLAKCVPSPPVPNKYFVNGHFLIHWGDDDAINCIPIQLYDLIISIWTKLIIFHAILA